MAMHQAPAVRPDGGIVSEEAGTHPPTAPLTLFAPRVPPRPAPETAPATPGGPPGGHLAGVSEENDGGPAGGPAADDVPGDLTAVPPSKDTPVTPDPTDGLEDPGREIRQPPQPAPDVLPATPLSAATGPPPFALLSTGCAALDVLLDGGLESDAVTLVFGEGGSGKTNLALQCSREAAARGRVAFVDTEGVSPRRLGQIMDGCPPELVRRLHFFKPLDLDQQTKMVEQATKLPGLRLLVLDSINMHYRLHMDTDDERAASRQLYRQLHRLTAFARSQEVPVLVTGQVYGDEDQTHPFARRLLEHLVKASVRFEKRPDGLRRATIVKHRSIEEGRRTRFRITERGLAGEAAADGGPRA